MIRPSLLTITASLALFTLTPSVFAASIVRGIAPGISEESDAGKLISLRALDRLHFSKDVAGPRVSLANGRLGGWLMLSGAPVEIAGSSLALPDQLSGIATCDAVPGSVESPAPAATEAVGPASAFGVVPEPSSVALLALGACSFLRRRRS